MLPPPPPPLLVVVVLEAAVDDDDDDDHRIAAAVDVEEVDGISKTVASGLNETPFGTFVIVRDDNDVDDATAATPVCVVDKLVLVLLLFESRESTLGFIIIVKIEECRFVLLLLLS